MRKDIRILNPVSDHGFTSLKRALRFIKQGRAEWVEHGVSIRFNNGHEPAQQKHTVVRQAEHHEGIPLGARQSRKTLVHIRQTAPVVEVRPLAAYESVAAEGGL